jgi:hypothetical protein
MDALEIGVIPPAKARLFINLIPTLDAWVEARLDI